MTHRSRVLAALLALFAFSASFAESVWASTCAPMEAPAGPARNGGVSAMPMPGMDTDGGFDDGSTPAEQSQHPMDAPECPFAALAPSGCQVVSAPAHESSQAVGGIFSRLFALAPADRAPHLLLVSSLFRPPRA